MPLAVTHVLLTIIVVDLYRDYVTNHKKYFSMHTLFIAGIFSLMPDIDIPLNFLFTMLGFQPPLLLTHRGITHTLLFALIFLIPAIYFWIKDKHKTSTYFFVASFAIMFHLFLDILFGGGTYGGLLLFYPLSMQPFGINIIPPQKLIDVFAAIDAIILLIWLWHEEVKHKISDFI